MLQTDILKPQSYVYGDTWNLEIRADQYPPSKGFVLTLTVIPVADGPSFQVVSNPTVPGTTDQHLLAFTGAAVEASGSNPGSFRCQAVITSPTDSTVRKTLGYFDLEIMPDYSLNYSEGYDPRSYNVKCLQALELVLANQASRDLLEYTFKDATFKYRTVEEQVKLRNYFQVEVDKEQGKLPGRYITKALYRPSYWGI